MMYADLAWLTLVLIMDSFIVVLMRNGKFLYMFGYLNREDVQIIVTVLFIPVILINMHVFSYILK